MLAMDPAPISISGTSLPLHHSDIARELKMITEHIRASSRSSSDSDRFQISSAAIVAAAGFAEIRACY